MKTLVVSHVTLVMSLLVVTLGPVRVMGAGVVVMMCVEEVCIDQYTSFWIVPLILVQRYMFMYI